VPTKYKSTFSIQIPADTPQGEIAAWVLATIACVPASINSFKWLQAKQALRRRIAELLPSPGGKIVLRAEDLSITDETMQTTIERVKKRADIALLAAHACMPFIVKHAPADSEVPLPRSYAQPGRRAENIDRALRGEATLDEQYANAGAEPRQQRGPSITSANADKNFNTRVIRPFKPVLHLACALAKTIDANERKFREHFDSSELEALGFSAYVIPEPDGGERRHPQLTFAVLLTTPHIWIDTLTLAEALIPGTECYLQEGRSPNPPSPIRLCLT